MNWSVEAKEMAVIFSNQWLESADQQERFQETLATYFQAVQYDATAPEPVRQGAKQVKDATESLQAAHRAYMSALEQFEKAAEEHGPEMRRAVRRRVRPKGSEGETVP